MRTFATIIVAITLGLCLTPAAQASRFLDALKSTGSQAYDNTGTLRDQSVTLTEPRSPVVILAMILNGLLILTGVFLTALIVYHGFRWVLGGGNPDTVKSARGAIINALIGLVIIMVSFSVSYFITRTFESASRGPQMQPGTNVQLPDDVQLNFKPF